MDNVIEITETQFDALTVNAKLAGIGEHEGSSWEIAPNLLAIQSDGSFYIMQCAND